MNFNVACSSKGCTNPVIGQCQGYGGKPCGKFYCATHTGYSLCAVCANQKTADLRLAEYEQLSEKIIKDSRYESERTPIGYFGAIAGGLAVILLVIAIVLAFRGIQISSSSTFFEQAVGLIILVGFPLGLLLGLLSGFYCRILAKRMEKSKANSLNLSKPGFKDYFNGWKAKRRKEELKAGLLLVGGLIVGVAAAAIESDARDSQRQDEDARRREAVERGVDDALKNRGL